MKKQAFNPYLPSWEYIPDGEPYVFGDRVYVYGSHDFYNGHAFCLGDYICYSAKVNDLSDWRYEGVIYERTEDPLNERNNMCLYAPDVTKGPDGRYYLYYVLDRVSIVSVAVCDEPAGKYKFYGYVHYEDGIRLGEKEGDEPQFDPGVLTEGDVTYLYTGFCARGDKSRHGAMCTVLDKDMLTIKKAPVFVAPGVEYAEEWDEKTGKKPGFEGHAFFEAPSIRKRNGLYYFIYSSTLMHELCYAVSRYPDKDFEYGGVIVSNTDVGIGSYKEADRPVAYGGNNHGSIVEIEGEWYIFYHRQTNGTWYSRQGCAERISFDAEGKIAQVKMSSCGLNGGPLAGKGKYPAYIACNLFKKDMELYADEKQPRIVQEGRDGDENPGYIENMEDTTTAGFKSFDCKGVKSIILSVRGYITGEFEIRDEIDGPVIGRCGQVEHSTIWEPYEIPVNLPDGVHDIYVTYTGPGKAMLGSIEFVC
ncbi:MAG: family 43 glycosylhydrolase [Lachnospiraceae bacterium]|nr:family 43 glycosylhydrolase [Lachnospiraceae bacterium]